MNLWTKVFSLVWLLWAAGLFFLVSEASASHCGNTAVNGIKNPESNSSCISVDFRFNRPAASDHGLSSLNPGFNPCLGEAAGNLGNGICDNGTGLLNPTNRQIFTELGPGTVTNNMFGKIVDFDGCIGVLSAGVCSAGTNTVTPDPGNRLFNAAVQGVVTPPMTCFLGNTPTGLETSPGICASGVPKTTTGQFYDAPRSNVGNLVLPSDPLTPGNTAGVNFGVATNSAGENLLEVFVWNPCASTANFGCSNATLNMTTPASTAPLVLTCNAPASGETRACSKQAVHEENPGVGSAFVGDVGSELMLMAASWQNSHTGSDSSVIPATSTVVVDWRVRNEQSTFRTDQTGTFTRCLGADADPADPCYSFRMQDSDYVTGKLQTWGGTPGDATKQESAVRCAVFPTPNSGMSTSLTPSDNGYWVDASSAQHGC